MGVMSLVDKTENSNHWTTRQALELALAELDKEGVFSRANKVLVVALDANGGMYDIGYVQAGMSSSECVALCDIAKANFLNDMGY